jgi:hypothetical protein
VSRVPGGAIPATATVRKSSFFERWAKNALERKQQREQSEAKLKAIGEDVKNAVKGVFSLAFIIVIIMIWRSCASIPDTPAPSSVEDTAPAAAEATPEPTPGPEVINLCRRMGEMAKLGRIWSGIYSRNGMADLQRSQGLLAFRNDAPAIRLAAKAAFDWGNTSDEASVLSPEEAERTFRDNCLKPAAPE